MMNLFNIHSLLAAWTFLLVITAGGSFAHAEENHSAFSVRSNQHYRIIACTNAETDSTCIGNPKSPLCAAETILAANLRDDTALHNIATGKRPGPAKTFTAAPDCMARIGYRVSTYRQFQSRDIFPPPRNQYGIKTGDVAFYLEMANCTYGKCIYNGAGDNRSFLLRKGEYGWFIIYGDNRENFTDLETIHWPSAGK